MMGVYFIQLPLVLLIASQGAQGRRLLDIDSSTERGAPTEPEEGTIHLRSALTPAWVAAQKSHTSIPLGDGQVSLLSRLSNKDRFMEDLNAIAIPRLAGTAGNLKVQKYLTNRMEKLGYKVETQTFTATPPPKFGGPVNMTNIFGTLNPSAPRRLVLACHFDSKLDSFGQFVGATDSAVPCAQMLDVATTLNSFLKKSNIRSSVTLQLLFFDGEEAYGDWSVTDSLYGARNLSEVWKATPNQFAPDDPSLSELNSIDLMVLLDLIGTIDTNFRNFYYSAHLHFEKMNSIETKLEDKGLIKQWGRSRPYFDLTPLPAKKWVDDDYRPFIEKGVKVMHLISTPFPSVWHKTSDNLDNIHYETIDDINKMLRVYVCGYLACNVEKPMY